MAEWSNATDLSSVLFGGAGSNPAGVILSHHTAILLSLFYQTNQNDDWLPQTNNTQWSLSLVAERSAVNRKVAGSIPAGGVLVKLPESGQRGAT